MGISTNLYYAELFVLISIPPCLISVVCLVAVCSTISKGIFALFGTTARSSARTVDAFGRQFQMPYVTPSAPSPNEVEGGGGERGGAGGDWAGKQHAFTLFMRPLYHKAILHVILAYKWSKIYYIHNTADGEWPRS